MTPSLGATPGPDGTRFKVRAAAERLTLCLFDGETETQIPMQGAGGLFTAFVPSLAPGARYGLR
ncbi:glycogen debranching enzyme, partial [Amaricoccus sp. HAR-UPW-R2A-40]